MRGMLFSLLCQQALKRKGRPSGLIGQYKPYLNSNDSPTRDILKDYSGNGHDIQLYNFAFAENSGYGKYATDFNDWIVETADSDVYRTSTNLIITSRDKEYLNATSCRLSSNTLSFTLKFRVIKSDAKTINLNIDNFTEEGYNNTVIVLTDLKVGQVYSYTFDNLSFDYTRRNIYFNPRNAKYFEVELIPDYKGALVSDGIDDYGLCENFPILTKEKGYTVCALRKILKPFEEIQANACLLSNYNNTEIGSFYIENRANNSWSTYSFGGITNYLDVDYDNDFVFQTSLSYNNYTINKGENTNPINRLYLFRLASWVSSYLPSALYALEIYDHDLTDEEIEKVKEAMYDEYLTATNALQNHIIADYECYDKTNEDEDRDVLKDLSGNGHDIQLYNFGFAENSGFGLYRFNFNNWDKNSDTVISEISSSKITFRVSISDHGISLPRLNFYYGKFILKVSNLEEGNYLTIFNNYNNDSIKINSNGIHTIDGSIIPNESGLIWIVLNKPNSSVTIEQIPEYQGALVSDGVDDYGLCENFPILNKENGYTVLAIRKYLESGPKTGALLSDVEVISNPWSILFESYGGNLLSNAGSFGTANANLVTLTNNLFTAQTSKSYNGTPISQGSYVNGNSDIVLFKYYTKNGYYVSFALYALKIFDRDLTDEEIEYEKKKMIQRYEEKTGNKYVEQ